MEITYSNLYEEGRLLLDAVALRCRIAEKEHHAAVLGLPVGNQTNKLKAALTKKVKQMDEFALDALIDFVRPAHLGPLMSSWVHYMGYLNWQHPGEEEFLIAMRKLSCNRWYHPDAMSWWRGIAESIVDETAPSI